MIVTCPECDTSFQLDESRVPAKGIRVRCSRCKHAFHLAHPSASRSEVVEAVASEAAASGGTSIPSVTQDLTSPQRPAARSATPAASDSQSFGGNEINNEDDAEWEFNHDVPASEAAAPAPARAESPKPKKAAPSPAPAHDDGGSVFGGSMHDGESGLDLATDDAGSGIDLDGGGERSQANTAPREESSGRTDFGSVDDFSSLMEDDDSQVVDPQLGDRTETDSLREQAAEQAGRYAGAGQSDELGDPESWDFFDGDSPTEPSTPRPQPSQGVALGRIGVSPMARTSVAPSIDADDFDESGLAELSRTAQVLQAAGRLVGWTVVIVTFALGLASGLWTTAESFVAGERTAALGAVEAVDMRAQWVDTARAGRVLLVTGGLRNATRSSTTVGGPIEIALLDRLGEPIAVDPTAVGVELEERQIRELPLEVLGRMRARAAQQLLGASIPAGGQLAFQAVILAPPREGLRFEIRRADGGKLSLPMPIAASPVSEAEVEPDEAGEVASDPVAVEPSGPVAGAASVEVEEAAGGEVPAPGAAPAEPGYDDAYGDDAGLGLQDL